MLRPAVALIVLWTVPLSAGADEDLGKRTPERVEAARGSPFPLPGPIYDDDGRLVAAPRPVDARGAWDVLLLLPALPEAVGDAGSEPRRSLPRRRGEP